MLYSAARFFLEYLRGDYNEIVLGMFKSAQMTSLVAFAIAFGFFVWLGLKKHAAAPPKKKERKKAARI